IRIPLLGAAVRLTPGVHLQVALWLVVAALLGFRAASRGSPGLGLAAVRSVPSQADALGIDGDRLLLGSFVTSAALGGVAGALSVHLVGVADPTAYGPLLSTELFIAVLLGGPGGTVGPMLGALVLVVTTGAARGLGVAALGPVRYAPAIAAGLL